MNNDYLEKNAVISECRTYRYTLSRVWDTNFPKLGIVMLNPSRADALKDDPTIRRCVGFAKRWKFGSLVVVNVYSARLTNPEYLQIIGEPIGPETERYFKESLTDAEMVLLAWGSNIKGNQAAHAIQWLQEVNTNGKRFVHLGLTKDGQPKHPLYIKSDTVPQPFNFERYGK